MYVAQIRVLVLQTFVKYLRKYLRSEKNQGMLKRGSGCRTEP